MASAKGDTTLKVEFLTAGEARAINAIRSVYGAQDAGMKKTAKEANALGLNFRKLGRSMLYGLAGYAGVTGVTAVMAELAEANQKIIDKRSELEKAITPLSSLGDNSRDLASLREEAIKYAALLDTTTASTAEMMFNLQSGTGNLSEAVRGDLRGAIVDIANAVGGDLVTTEKLLVGAYQNFGSEVTDVTQLSNKLLYTQDKASLSFQQLGDRLGEVASVAGVVDISMDSLLGTIIGGTQKRIPVEKFFTGLRNVLLLMNDEEKQKKANIDLNGTYIQQLEQLQQLSQKDPGAFRKMFGQESIVVATAMVNALPEIKTGMQAISNITGETSMAQEKIANRLEDSVNAMVRIDEINKRLREESTNIAGPTAATNPIHGFFRERQLAALGGAVSNGLPADSFVNKWGYGLLSLFSDKPIEMGKQAELQNVAPGAERDAILRNHYEMKKKQDLRELKIREGLLFGPMAGLAGNTEATRKEIESRQFNLEAERAAHPYTPLARATPEAQDLAGSDQGKEMIQLMREIAANTAQGVNATVGGNPANAMEGGV